MAEAKFSIGQVNITGYLRVIAREMTNDGASVAESANIVYAPPQPTTRNIVIADLNPIPHQFEFYESVDGVALGTLLSIFEIDVGKISQSVITQFEFVVGRGQPNDPEPGTKEYTNSLLVGYTEDQLYVAQRALGKRSFLTGEIVLLEDGGFKLPDAGDEVFIDEDFWSILAINNIVVQDPVNITRGKYRDIIEFADDITIDDTHYDCLLEAQGADTDVLTITFPALDTIPNDTAFGITTHGGLQRYVAVQLDSGDVCRFMGAEKNIFWLGNVETIYMIVKNGILKVSEYDGDYRHVGSKVKSDLGLYNVLPETGGWYDIDEYPRIFYEFVNNLNPAHLSAVVLGVVSEKTKFAIDLPNNRFWMPDTGGYVERNVDPNGDIDSSRSSGNRYSGTTQAGQVGSHTHSLDDSILTEGEPGSGPGGTTTGSSGPPPDTVANSTDASGENRMINVAINSWRIR